jgi:D-tyrosyl-tRNA(Tyr) deacylase
MRAVLQRVASASVTAGSARTGAIGAGLLVLVGIEAGDTPADAVWLAAKTVHLRVFGDGANRMNRSVLDSGADILVVSQFTLLASTRKGHRPSFSRAAPPQEAIPLYEAFLREIAATLGRPPQTGVFGAAMRVSIENDGPVTVLLDSRLRE